MKDEMIERGPLIGTALGETPPDLVVRGGNLVNVLTGEIHPADILIKGRRIAAVVDSFDETVDCPVIQAAGKYLVPGFIDPHIHIETSSVTVTEFAKSIVPKGVTMVIEDPHEISNVLGVRGIDLLFEEAKRVPLRFMLRVPGQVPALDPSLETSGAAITVDESKQLLEREETMQLAGDYHAGTVFRQEPGILEKIGHTIRLGKTVGGQSPGLPEPLLNAYVAAGSEDSHVSSNIEEVIDILRHGLKAILTPRDMMFSEADYGRLAVHIKETGIDTRRILFCTDDRHVELLYRDGHLDDVIRLAIRQGFDPITAIQMATINVAQHLRIERDFGSITPGRVADIVLLGDLEDVRADMVIMDGEIVAENGSLVEEPEPYPFPAWATNTVRLKHPVTADDFKLRSPDGADKVKVRALYPAFPTPASIEVLATQDGVVMPDEGQDILSMAVVERHKGTGNIANGFLKGTGITGGAVASSVSHDAHNIYVIGSDHASMAVAVNRLAEIGGGHVVVKGEEVIGEVHLPVAGMMAQRDLTSVALELEEFEDNALCGSLGCSILENPLFFFSILPLANAPDWALTDKGLIEWRSMSIHDVLLGAAEE